MRERRTLTSSVLLALGVFLLLLSSPVQADPIGGDPCPTCGGGTAISLTEGNLKEQVSIAQIKSSTAATIDFSLTYNSYNADGSRADVDTVLPYGWTHPYNVFLFNQRGHMFRMDGDGRVTKYRRGAGGSFTADTGYFETLVQNSDGTFTLTQKDRTVFRFASIPLTPFLVAGPVFRLTSIVDRNNNVTTLSYTNGDLTSINDTYGRSLALRYDARRKLIAITDPLGRTSTIAYDLTGRKLISVTDPEGKATKYGQNFLYQITDKVDKDGRTFAYVYDNLNKPVSIGDGAGTALFRLTNPQEWATDPAILGRDLLRAYVPATTSKTDGQGNVWRYDYDSRGYITRSVAPDGATITYTYDPVTLMVASVTDANNHTTRYEYDAQGNRTKVTNALNQITTFTYESVFNKMTSMKDPNGRTTTYEYDGRGNRIRETDPLGATREWTYDVLGNVLTEKDKNGNVTMYQYDASGNRTRVIDAIGKVTSMTYDGVGNLLSRTDANGHVTLYEYDGLNRLVRETDPVGGTTKTSYDGAGNRVQVIDRNGNPTIYQYDLRKRLIRTTDALNQAVSQTYDGNDNRTSSTDKNGHTTTFQYDVQNRLIGITDALGNRTQIAYDRVGNKTGEADANVHVTKYEYDALNRMILRTDAEANFTRMAYDMVGVSGCPQCTGPTKGSNLPTKQTDGNGKVTYFKYDGLDRLILQIRKEGDTADLIDASDAVTRYTYDAQGNRLTITEPNGNITTSGYDALNRQVRRTNAAGDLTVITYDPVSKVKTVTAPNGNITTYSYDTLDRLIQLDDSVGRVASYTYDAVGNRLTERDGNGHGTTNTYDAIYRLTNVVDALGLRNLYVYDPVGNLVIFVDTGGGNQTNHFYDALNRRIQTSDSLGNKTQYQYDGVGNLIRVIDANTHPTLYVYDGINRLTKETYADGRMRAFTYDPVGNRLSRTDQKGQTTRYVYNDLYFLTQRAYPVSPADTFTYDLSGRMLTAERGGWLVTFQYDGANRVTQATQNARTLSYVYNIPGRTRTLTYPGGRTLTENTDARDRLGTINDAASPIVQYAYDLGNRVGSRAYRNGTTASYTYNANNWVLSLDHTIGGSRIAGFTYDLDTVGNKRFEQKLHDPGDSEAFQYDQLHRLIDFRVGSLVGSTVPVPVTQAQYNLDGVGNWKTKVQDGVPENRTHSVTNEITQIGAVPILSDFNGNTSEDELYRYAHDEENRLTTVTRKVDNRVVGQYWYDALSRRIAKSANAAAVSSPVETVYFYDGERIVEEQSAGAITLATYIYGNYIDEVLTLDRAGQTYYYHQNSLWSVEVITDSRAAVVERYNYDAYGFPTVLNLLPANPWGTAHSAIGNSWMFTGRQFDEETGVYFYRARYYDAVKGRFLQRDPLEYLDGMNLYAAYFVPNALDPDGLGWIKKIIDAIKGAEKGKAAARAVKEAAKLVEQMKKHLPEAKRILEEHKKKLADYLKHPDAADNKGVLAACKDQAERDRRIAERVRSLEKQIKGWERDVAEAEEAIATGEKFIKAGGVVAGVVAAVVAPYSKELSDLQKEGADVGAGAVGAAAALDIISIVDPGIIDVIDWATGD